MITKNPMQLKAFIKKKVVEKNISAQLVMQNYMLERLLERISLSKYKHNFILKGGFLISAIVGLDTRATMDLDTTIKGFTLTHESIREIFGEICAVEVADDVKFELVDISDIREGDDYPGIRVALKRTSDKRGSSKVLEMYMDIIAEIRVSEQLRGFWKKYQRDFDYAKDISFDDVCDTVQRIMDSISF